MRVRRAGSVLLAALTGVLASPAGTSGQEVLSQREALRLAFPEPAEIERRTAFLDSADLRRAEEIAAPSVEVDETVLTYYVARREGEGVGVAYFDAHVVRTLREVLMVVVQPGGTVGRVEVLSFGEPREYRPPVGWLEEFRGRSLADRLSTKGDVINVTGATLTSRAVTRAVRRVLALHRVIDPLDEGDDPSSSEAGEDRREGRP